MIIVQSTENKNVELETQLKELCSLLELSDVHLTMFCNNK